MSNRTQEYMQLCKEAREAAKQVDQAQRALDEAGAEYKRALLRRRRMELWLKLDDAAEVRNATLAELSELEKEALNA